jgi:hypothetical protein
LFSIAEKDGLENAFEASFHAIARKVNNHLQSGWLEYSSCSNCRWQEKTEARLCLDVELAVAPGWGKNHCRRGTARRPSLPMQLKKPE